MKILENISLAEYTTFKIGGKAKFFAVVKSLEEFSDALDVARAQKLTVFILGGGSNVLVSDRGFDGLVIKMEMRGASCEGEIVTAWAGEVWDDLVAKTVEWNLWGLENLSLIPGTVGAAPVQNIGAYGTEIMNVIESVRTMDIETRRERIFSNAECGFTYRDSIFKKPEYKKYAITSVSFKLSLTPKPNLLYKDIKEYVATKQMQNPSQLDIRNAVIEIRTGKFPDLRQVGTAGSFWKNPIISRAEFESLALRYPGLPSFPANAPAGSRDVTEKDDRVKVPLAWILDNVCGLKGYTQGPVGLFKKQPLVLVASSGADAKHIDDLAGYVATMVQEKTGIEIEREVGTL